MKSALLACLSALALAGCLTEERPAAGNPPLRLACQMWGVKGFWEKDPANGFREVFPRVRALGYEGVQSMAFWKVDPDVLESLLKENGLVIADMPVKFTHLEGEAFDKTVAFCKRFGVTFVYVPYHRPKKLDGWREFADRLDACGRKLAPHGIRIGYHHHIHEFAEKLDGAYPADVLLSDPRLAFEPDVGPILESGRNPANVLRQLKGRIPGGFHAKPYPASFIGAPDDRQDWPAILSAAKAAGAKWVVIECEQHKDTYADVAASAKYLKPLLK